MIECEKRKRGREGGREGGREEGREGGREGGRSISTIPSWRGQWSWYGTHL